MKVQTSKNGIQDFKSAIRPLCLRENLINTANSHINIKFPRTHFSTNSPPRVRFVPFFGQKLQGLSRTHFPFFKDFIQCKKEP